MMPEKYPTWLEGHVKEWTEKRLPTVTLCSSTGKELLEVWYCGDLLTVKGEPQSYIVDGDEVPGLVAARDPESGEEFVIFDGGRHGYDNLFCDVHDPSKLEHRPLKRYGIPASKLVVELGYSVDYEDEKEDFEPDGADTVASVILLVFYGSGLLNVLNAAFVYQMQSESLLAIPMFALMAAFLQTSGIGGDIYEFFHKWLGGINGGLAMATVATTAVIAAMSGVAATATIMMGLIALPAMLDRGYDKALATGPVLAGGCLGPIIPPSTIMIIMSSYTGVSAGWLFAGGALPGVGLALLFIIYIGIRCAINPKLGPGIPKAERPSWGEKMRVFKKVIAPIAIIVLVLGCIYAGIATPTEAAGVGAFASMVYALITRKLNVKNLRASLIQTMEVSAMLMWILMGGAAYNSLVNITRLSDVVAAAFASSNLDGLPLMLLIFALFFVMGMFLDTTPIIMIAIPILLPVIQASSLDTNATILILCVTLCLGMITPPFGINMFYLQGVAPPGVDTKVMYKAVMPYVIIFLVACFFMMLFPELIVIFPNAAMGY